MRIRRKELTAIVLLSISVRTGTIPKSQEEPKIEVLLPQAVRAL